MAQRIHQKKYQSSAYVSGNTVKKLYTAVPKPEVEAPRRKTREQTEEEQKQRAARQHQIHRANRMNFLYTAAVSGIVAVIFGICFQYLNLQSTVKGNAAEVTQLQAQLNELTSANDEKELEINAGINYDEIYNTAVNELGMVYPERDQVITYEPGVSEYVKQYEDIPSAAN